MSYIQRLAGELRDTLSRKNHDYAPTDEFSNFRLAAELAGLLPFDAMLIQIGIKYSRLLGLNNEGEPEYESFRDSLVDLAGYAVIAAAFLDREKDDSKVIGLDEFVRIKAAENPDWHIQESGDDE